VPEASKTAALQGAHLGDFRPNGPNSVRFRLFPSTNPVENQGMKKKEVRGPWLMVFWSRMRV
jgi:hypothetical protein